MALLAPQDGGCVPAGVALAHVWHLGHLGDAAADSDADTIVRRASVRGCRARGVLGFLTYPVVEVAAFRSPACIDSPSAAWQQLEHMMQEEVHSRRPGRVGPPSICT